jgi:hypothetical protein
MNGPSGLDTFLDPDPGDVGCGETLRLLDVYVDLLATGRDPARRFPGVAAHLRGCPPCNEDFRSLLAAITADRRER